MTFSTMATRLRKRELHLALVYSFKIMQRRYEKIFKVWMEAKRFCKRKLWSNVRCCGGTQIRPVHNMIKVKLHKRSLLKWKIFQFIQFLFASWKIKCGQTRMSYLALNMFYYLCFLLWYLHLSTLDASHREMTDADNLDVINAMKIKEFENDLASCMR